MKRAMGTPEDLREKKGDGTPTSPVMQELDQSTTPAAECVAHHQSYSRRWRRSDPQPQVIASWALHFTKDRDFVARPQFSI